MVYSITMWIWHYILPALLFLPVIFLRILLNEDNKELIRSKLPEDVPEPVKIYGHSVTRPNLSKSRRFTVSYKDNEGKRIYRECLVKNDTVVWLDE